MLWFLQGLIYIMMQFIKITLLLSASLVCANQSQSVGMLPPLPTNEKLCVVLLHGLLRNSQSMEWIAQDLRKAGYRAVVPDYPSTRRTIQEHSEWLRDFIQDLPCDSIYLVTHSLGGLIARDCFGRYQPEKVKKLVMIAPPNHGAERADRFRKNALYKLVFGKVAQEVTSDSVLGPEHLGVPQCPFGIIAGGKGKEGYDKDIPGNNDGVLSVQKAYLKGAQDFLVLNASHNSILLKKETSDNIISFLRYGHFINYSQSPDTIVPQRPLIQKQ
jgi:predicted alpha/beta hydrolase family esterase